jgi:hypothetical protein
MRDDIVLLVGAEGCSEAEGQPWLRDATPEETTSFMEFAGTSGTIDHTGRPYFYKVVKASAPDHIWEKASRCLRVVRL